MTGINSKVVLFDGVCNLCNSSVDFIIRNDSKGHFKLAAIQSKAGQELMHKAGMSDEEAMALDSVLLYENGIIYKKSKAALRIARKLRFPINLMWAFMIVPAFIRDFVYDIIAANRYRWFGKKETCRLPTPEEKSRFLE